MTKGFGQSFHFSGEEKILGRILFRPASPPAFPQLSDRFCCPNVAVNCGTFAAAKPQGSGFGGAELKKSPIV
jgi:hypothetical protein